MFPNFTGSSRKTRNVNLSGQKAVNPFATASKGQNAAPGAAKTIAIAQAERQQRQQERDRLKAAVEIQRVWRGHRVRRDFRSSCRASLARVYQEQQVGDVEQRSIYAVPLILGTFQASRSEDHIQLAQVAQDLVQTRFDAFRSGAIDSRRLGKLSRLLVTVLERDNGEGAQFRARIFLDAFTLILAVRPESITPILGRYYKVLGNYYHQSGLNSQAIETLRNAAVTPLSATNVHGDVTRAAYTEFAFSFLTQPDLLLFEHDIDIFVSMLDLAVLSESIATGISNRTEPQASLLWLLAHLIALQKASKQTAPPPLYPKALYQLLSLSSYQIRAGFTTDSRGSNGAKELQESLPPYVASELASLINKDEILGLLNKFTTNHEKSSTTSEVEDAGFFAGYILTLMYCFPGLGDDIRMRLYLADIPTRQGRVPSIKFFWDAISKTAIFSAIVSDADAALGILRRRKHPAQFKAIPEMDSEWHREWRTVLLFLELYVFVLRLMDDDDFFSAVNPSMASGNSVSRLRSSGLSLKELKPLTLFLKHLSFVLYYNAATILEEATGAAKKQDSLGDFLASPARRRNSDGVGNKDKGSETFVITAGIDFDAFRNLVATAMKMLYERDSRRPFLPKQYWLMTSKFDMEGFLSAVVLEEERQRALREAGEDRSDDSDGDDMDIDQGAGHQPAPARAARSRLMQMARMKAHHKKTARDRLLAATGPKLEILRNMPFVIPFETRVQIFRQFIILDKQRRRGGFIDPDQWRLSVLQQHGSWQMPTGAGRDILSKHTAKIKRGQVFTDALNQFWKLEDGLKEPIQITFVDEFDIQEAGIDGGGVTKEFLTSVTKEAFTQDQRLFVTNSRNSYYPNPAAVDQQKEALREAGVQEGTTAWQESVADLLRQYEFLGRIIGKCMYEGILIDIVFAGFFLLKWTSAGAQDTTRANINDLHELDKALYDGMLQLKTTDDIASFDIDFTITDQVSQPDKPFRTVNRELIPNGSNIRVTNENHPLYISYVARHRLAIQPFAQTRAFLRGLSMIIDPAWLSMFNQNELQRLVGGDNSSIDIEDLRRHTIYSGVYEIGDDGEEHPTVKLFWEVMHQLDDQERRDVLKYVTSTPRAPLLGFSQLRPAFSIRDGGLDQERLPSASTCVNLLKLPQYKTAEVLKNKLLYAVTSGAGFDLS